MRPILVFALVACHSSSLADVTHSIDLVDPSDPITQPPAGVISVDIRADVDANDWWQAAGLRGVVTPLGQSLGVTLRYAPGDPNNPDHDELLDPGTANRFVTFFTKPRLGRNSQTRYESAGAGIAGRYDPTGPVRTATPSEINVVWFKSPPEDESPPGIDGYIARVSFDVSALLESHPRVAFEVGDPGSATGPVIFASFTENDGPGTVSATWNFPQPTGFDWAIWYVPEPGALVSLVIAYCVFPFRAVTRRSARSSAASGRERQAR